MTIIDNVLILSELKTEADALKVCTHAVKNKVQFYIVVGWSVKGDICWCKKIIGIATQEEHTVDLYCRA